MKNLIYTMLFLTLVNSCQSEEERLKEENHKKYENNSLSNGAMPYYKFYGDKLSCLDYLECSTISVQTSSDSDVIVSIKNENKDVVSHAYIKAESYYEFKLPNGRYQVFFYYGTGWDPYKKMKSSHGDIVGGFLDAESFGKDDYIDLYNNTLDYTLVSQVGGNFSTSPSNSTEAL
jgi:hypothetical protein